VVGNGQSSLVTPTIIFRDIIPAGMEHVDFTIYRSDPGDVFAANFVTGVSINGGPVVTVDTGHLINGFYHPPITGSLGFAKSITTGTLDFYFFDPGGGSSIRLNGIQNDFSDIPEPSVLGLLAIGGLMWRHRRRQ